ncbi:MAG: hypothetical protein WC485_00710 [Opitutaceae bacterium]
MNKPALLIRSLVASAGWLGGLTLAQAQTAEQIISKARAYLGDEATLSAVKSVHFVGTMETRQLAPEGPKPLKFTIDIIFQKPYQQLITRSTPAATEITGLDDYDGWQRIQDMTDPSRWQLTLLDPAIIKKLRANTWENLNFFKGIEKRGGSVQVVGPTTIDGTAVVKVTFVHEPGIIFHRYFDSATGKLVLTETDQGDRIKEEGEIMVDGLRFPQKVTTASKATDAKGQLVENPVVITFDKITLNEVFPESVFAVPPLTPPQSTRAATH